MKTTIKLFDTDKETSPGSHLIIPRDVAVKAVDEFNQRIKNEGLVYGTFGNEKNIGEVSHKIMNISINDDGAVYMELETFGTPRGRLLSELLSIDTRLMPDIIGNIQEIKYAKVTSFNFTTNLLLPV